MVKYMQLTQRFQHVLVDGQQSEFVPVQSGVPQGTVLGPLRFLVLMISVVVSRRAYVSLLMTIFFIV